MIGKPILRIAKIKRTGKSTIASVDGHNSRTRPVKNADSSRSHLNRWIAGGPSELRSRVKSVMIKAGLDNYELRRDATVANDILLSISPEWFWKEGQPNTWDPKKVDAFQAVATQFLKEQFPGRVCSAVMHLDESTPHVQAVVVPIVKREMGFSLSGRDYFNPERMKALQEDWQTRLEPLGVGPRTVGSTATHQTIKSYYSTLQAAPGVPDPKPPSPPPLAALLPGGSGKLEAWKKSETDKVRKRNKALDPLIAKGMLYQAEKISGDNKSAKLKGAYDTIGKLRQTLANISDDMEITKAEITRLRALPIAEIANALEYTGELGKRENAIDLVKRVGGLDYQESIRWLAHTFGVSVAGAAVRENSKTDPSPVPLTPADKVKSRAISTQLDALDAPGYRITIMSDIDGEKVGKNLGKSKDNTPEKFWNKSEVLRMLPKLTAENARGGNIFITPVDNKVHHALVDDLKNDDLVKFKKLGYSASTIIETSPGNHQAVIKIPKSVAPVSAVNEWFKAINRELGDDKITGLIHPMRLAGFQNRKPKYDDGNGRFPFVKVIEAARTLCAHARAVVISIASQMTIPEGPKGP